MLQSKNKSVVAVNFAGVQKSESSAAVISTLLDSFAQCRGYRDALGESGHHEDGALKNMVGYLSF